MKAKASVWTKTGLILLLVGAAVFLIGSIALDFDYTRLDTRDLVKNTLSPEGAFRSLRIRETTANVSILRAEDGVCHVELLEDKKAPHTVRVQGDTLLIEQPNAEKWHLFSFHLRQTYVKVYLPNEAYGALDIDFSTGDIAMTDAFVWENIRLNGSTGDVLIKGASAKDMRLNLSTGNVTLESLKAQSLGISLSTGDTALEGVALEGALSISSSTGGVALSGVRCAEIRIDTSTGSVEANDTIASGAIKISCTTGDISLAACDAEELLLTTTTGEVEGSLLTQKHFQTNSDTGDISVPYGSADAGLCRIETDTGDITISVP